MAQVGVQADLIGDLITISLKDLGRLKWSHIGTDIQEHVALRRILKKKRVRYDSGYGTQWNVQVRTSSAARHTRMHATDQLIIEDTMKTASAPWRHTETHWVFDAREPAMNSGAAKIVDIIDERRVASMIGYADKFEQAMWSAPTDSDDDLTPWGIPYYVVKNATTGFNGGHPSGFSDVAGLSQTTYPNHANFTAQYVNVAKTDLIRKMRKAGRETRWMSPVEFSDYHTGDNYEVFMNSDTIGLFEEAAEQQNENLGPDVASMDGRTTFKRNPVIYAPYLDNDSTDPVYMLNWGSFNPVFLKGWYMKESPPIIVGDMHNERQTFVDTTWNLRCTTRRRQTVISK